MEMNHHNNRNCEHHNRDHEGRGRERNREFQEVCIDGVLFKFRLNEIREGVCELVAVPCQQPTLILCVAEIRKKENCCTNMLYFQATINSHNVEIIQDCSLEKIVKEAIKIYFRKSNVLCPLGRKNRNFDGFAF